MKEENTSKTNNAPVKIDNKDKAIIKLLNENARVTSKFIGSSINTSREVADYRIKRLINNGLISGFITLINDKKLGYDSYEMFLQLQNFNIEEEDKILAFLTNHKFIKWVLKCSGDWDIQIALMAKNKTHLASIVDEIDNFCGKCLRKYELSLIINLLIPENLKFLMNPQSEKGKSLKDLPPTDKNDSYALANIDDKDKTLLNVLAKDARLPIVKIAEKIKLSADATNLRIKKLQKMDVIKKFQTVIDLSKLNYLLYSVFLKINNYSPSKENQIRTFFHTMPNITYAQRILGNWDVRVQISCATPQEFNKILTEMRQFLAKDLKYYNFTLMIKEVKRVSYPEGIVHA